MGRTKYQVVLANSNSIVLTHVGTRLVEGRLKFSVAQQDEQSGSY
jgi:hypothetical protein